MLRQKRWTPTRRVERIPLPANALVAECQAFLEWTLAVGLSAETAKLRKAALERFARWCSCVGVKESGGITHSVLEGYQHHLATLRKANGENLASTTQATRLNPVIAFCRWLARQGKTASDPSLRLV